MRHKIRRGRLNKQKLTDERYAMSNNLNNHKTHYRRNITIIVAVISVLISATFFILMMQRLFYMHIIFYLTLGISFLIVAYLMLWTLSSYDRFARLAKYLKYGYFSCLLIGFLCFIILLVLIISGAYSEDTDVDVIIVLGAGVWRTKWDSICRGSSRYISFSNHNDIFYDRI